MPKKGRKSPKNAPAPRKSPKNRRGHSSPFDLFTPARPAPPAPTPALLATPPGISLVVTPTPVDVTPSTPEKEEKKTKGSPVAERIREDASNTCSDILWELYSALKDLGSCLLCPVRCCCSTQRICMSPYFWILMAIAGLFAAPTMYQIYKDTAEAYKPVEYPLRPGDPTFPALVNDTTMFVGLHGLMGNGETYHVTIDGNPANWLVAYLQRDLPGTYVYMYEYRNPALVLQLATSADLEIRAANLLELLDTLIGDLHVRIIFICHSYGGLLAEKAYVQAANSPLHRLHRIYEMTIGFVFYGVPHRGSALHERCYEFSWLGFHLCRAFFRLSSITVSELEADNPMLVRLDEDFVKAAENIRTLNVYELRATYNFLGIGLTIVPEPFARLGVNQTALESKDEHIGADADHFGVCKPVSDKVLEYIKTLAFCKKVMGLVSNSC